MSQTNGTTAANGKAVTNGNGALSSSSEMGIASASNGGLGVDMGGTNGHASAKSLATISDMAIDEDVPGSFVPLFEGSQLDKREFVRIVLQALRELGFEGSASALEAESGITLEHDSIVAFRKAILTGDWKDADTHLIEGLKHGANRLQAQLEATALGTAGPSRQPAISSTSSSSASSSASIDLVLRNPQARGLDAIKFLINQQRYLELLEARQTRKALTVLRDRLTPLNHGSDRLHQLSSLVICATPEEMRTRAKWPGAGQASRRRVLEEIESAILPTVMVPSRRLPQLLEQAQQLQKSKDPFFNLPQDTRISLYTDHSSDPTVFPTRTAAILNDHTDEVWHIAFSHDGTKLASASKDKHVIVWSVGTRQSDFEVLHRLGPLTGAVCHVAFSPDDKRLLATSNDGEVVTWKLEGERKQEYKGHVYTVAAAAWLDNSTFVTGGMDRTVIFWNEDGTRKRSWSVKPFRVQALDVSPDGKYLITVSERDVPIGTRAGGGTLRSSYSGQTDLLDERILQEIEAAARLSQSPESGETGQADEWSSSRVDGGAVVDLGGGSRTMTGERFQLQFYDLERQEEIASIYMWEEMTSVSFSEDSRYVLINQRPNDAQLWDVQRQSLIQRFSGHRIQHHVVRSCFGGAEKSFIISGSEDGAIHVYHRRTGKLLERLRGHGPGTVSSVAWHPQRHNMFASCGDDGTVRIWRPVAEMGKEAEVQAADASLNGKSSLGLPHQHPGNGYQPFGLSMSSSNGHEREYSADAAMGPSPFPWATSPRAPNSPGTQQRRARRQAASRRAAAVAAAGAAAVAASGASAAMSRAIERDDDDDDDEDEDDEEEEEEGVDDEEEGNEEEEEDVMEEGGD